MREIQKFSNNAAAKMKEVKQRVKVGLPLLDLLADEMKCDYLSDLRFLSPERKRELAERLKKIAPEAYDLQVWNDALVYLVGEAAEETAAAAKNRLVEGLV